MGLRWRRKPRRKRVDYVALMHEADTIRARFQDIHSEAKCAASASNLHLLKELDLESERCIERLREIAMEVGAPLV